MYVRSSSSCTYYDKSTIVFPEQLDIEITDSNYKDILIYLAKIKKWFDDDRQYGSNWIEEWRLKWLVKRLNRILAKYNKQVY